MGGGRRERSQEQDQVASGEKPGQGREIGCGGLAGTTLGLAWGFCSLWPLSPSDLRQLPHIHSSCGPSVVSACVTSGGAGWGRTVSVEWVLVHGANSKQARPELGWGCILGGPSKVSKAT